ncbi:hypothetical protein NEFER01_1662 [Nematocida sp. LUAm1]|nr:hypothetical protein NEFER02_1507 [Nematocida sp. LUAm2]KAI5178526.1 hypothetical protein NEFER01_1662 [Nematocida sp. LUAm1]
MNKNSIIKLIIVGTISIITITVISVGIWHMTRTDPTEKDKDVPISQKASTPLANADKEQPASKEPETQTELSNANQQILDSAFSTTENKEKAEQKKKKEKELQEKAKQEALQKRTEQEKADREALQKKTEQEKAEQDALQKKAEQENTDSIDWDEYMPNMESKETQKASITNCQNNICCIIDIKFKDDIYNIGLEDDMLGICPKTKKYIIDTTKDPNIEKVFIGLPDTQSQNSEVKKEEKTIAKMLHWISEIRVRDIDICLDPRNKSPPTTDLYILIAIMSKIRGCNEIRFIGMRELTTNPIYKDKLDIPIAQIINQEIKDIKITLYGRAPLKIINVFMKRLFAPNLKRISSISILNYNLASKEEMYKIFQTYNLNYMKETSNTWTWYPNEKSTKHT